ncbi:hypothetical protein BC826DRAFT_991438 [Russula brevipes]|nr:hypothetical protein BC826DRAFT_991438 [Russula brevipes]
MICMIAWKFFLFSVLSATLFVVGVSAQTINTPVSVLSCSPLQITFSGGTRSVHDGATPSGPPLQTFSNITSSPFTWAKVTYAPNRSLGLNLIDSTGAIGQSAPFTVAGTDVSCLNGTATTAATPAATTPAATTPAGTTTGGTTSSSTTSSRAATPNAANGTSTRPSSTTTPNGAMPISVPYGAAGVLGAVVAVVFA